VNDILWDSSLKPAW